MSRLGLIIAAAAVLVLSAETSAQTLPISGRVVDQQGGAVANAAVTLKGANLRPATTRTAADGTFALQVAAGMYTLEVEAPGFLRVSQPLSVAEQAPPIKLTLQVAGVNEDVVVSASTTLTLEKVAPTASRLGLTNLDTPASVQVMPGALIRERGDVAVSEATTRATGVTTQWTVGNGGGGLSARGFQGVGSVLQLYDGVQLFIGAATVSFPFDTWMVDRIEVLGGPGSVLYGNGAIGGVVNVVPRKPNPLAFEHSGRVNYGSDNTVSAAVDSTGPVNSRTSYRVAVSQNNTDGWIERGEGSSTALSAALRREFSPTFNLTLAEDFGHQRPTNYYGVPLVNGRLDTSLRARNYNVTDADTKFDDNRTHLKTEWMPSSRMSVRTNVFYLTAERLWHRLGNFTYQPATDMILRQRVMEVLHHQRQWGGQTDTLVKGRVSGRDNALSVGVSYNFIRFDLLNNNPAAGQSLVPLDNPSSGTFSDFALSPTIPMTLTHTHAVALYSEDRLALSSRLAVVVGGRWDRSAVERLDGITHTTSNRTFLKGTGRGGLVFDVAQRTALYGQFATATDSIGEMISQTPQQQAFKLTTGRQTEAGVKQAFADDRGEWTVAAYRIVKNNLLAPDPNNTLLSIQIGQQSSQGVEASATVIAGGGVRVEANGTLLHAQFDDFSEVVAGLLTSRVGNLPPNVPRQAANLWLTWDAPRQWQARAGLRYVGKRFIDNANLQTMPAYTVLDAGLRKRLTHRAAVDLRLYNLTDEVYARGFWNGNASSQQWLLGAPRTAEISLTTSF